LFDVNQRNLKRESTKSKKKGGNTIRTPARGGGLLGAEHVLGKEEVLTSKGRERNKIGGGEGLTYAPKGSDLEKSNQNTVFGEKKGPFLGKKGRWRWGKKLRGYHFVPGKEQPYAEGGGGWVFLVYVVFVAPGGEHGE